MNRSWKVGTAFNIGIYVHWTFLFLPAWVLLTTWGVVGPSMIVYLLALMGAIFGCVVLHELGHALMARHFGIRTRDITLYPIGGVARLERMSERPVEELLIAVAGPAVNVAIAALLFVVLGLTGTVFSFDWVLESTPGGFLASLLASNVFLVLFNMLPAFPMDGGRVLRAVLSLSLGRLRATEIAATLGVVVAIGMAVVGLLWLNNPMMILVAGFVFFAGQQELLALRRREAMLREEPLEVLPVDDVVTVRPESRFETAFTGLLWDARNREWVLWQNGQAVARYGFPPE